VNIELPGPDVLSLVSERNALTVMTILVEGLRDMREHFEVGSEVSISGGLVHAPGISIQVRPSHASIPSAAGVGQTARARVCRDRLARIIVLAMDGDGGDSLLGLIADLQGEGRRVKDLDPIARMIRPRIEVLTGALASGEIEHMAKAEAGLVGLGQGLTPSGDDLLCGLMLAQAYGVRVPGGPRPVPEVNHAVIKAAASQTHLLSRVMLERAARGVTTVGLDRLLRSLVEKEPPGLVETAARAVLDLGATSGRDFLAGVVLAWTPESVSFRDD